MRYAGKTIVTFEEWWRLNEEHRRKAPYTTYVERIVHPYDCQEGCVGCKKMLPYEDCVTVFYQQVAG